MTSAVYQGTVMHRRLRPVTHRFRYRVFYLYLDVDEIDDRAGRLRLFSHNRFNLFSLFDLDHGAGDGRTLRRWADDTLAEAGIRLPGGTVHLLAFPRVLGYVFNPLAVWYCHDAEGRLRAVIHEVRNTFGDKHSYVVGVDGPRHEFAKRMHVSPFMEMDQTYSFTVLDPGERLTVSIRQRDRDGELLRAVLTGKRRILSDRTLLTLFVTHPLVTLKSISAIHWEALRLWWKGVRFHRRPDPPTHTVSVVERGVSA